MNRASLGRCGATASRGYVTTFACLLLIVPMGNVIPPCPSKKYVMNFIVCLRKMVRMN